MSRLADCVNFFSDLSTVGCPCRDAGANGPTRGAVVWHSVEEGLGQGQVEERCVWVWVVGCSAASVGVGVFWMLCAKMYEVCCTFPDLMRAVCRLEETQDTLWHFLPNYFHLLPLLLWTSGMKKPLVQQSSARPLPINIIIPLTSPKVVPHFPPTDRSSHIGELLNCTVHGTFL